MRRPTSRGRGVALRLLRSSLGDPGADFRPGQWEAIDALVNRRSRLLVVERTGWGKSTVYFLSTRLLRDAGRGPTLIVSPLLALMRNQIEAAARLGVRAISIDSTNTREWPALMRQVRGNGADVLLVSPERLANEKFIEEVLLPIATNLGLLVVDEAHCISDWGHDFRPDYRRLNEIIRRVPRTLPILGTTATANDRVVEDASQQLGALHVQRGPMMRETLELQTLRIPQPADRLAWLAEHLADLPGTGIIYVLTKRDAELVSDWLNQKGFLVRPYYAGKKDPRFENSDAYRKRLELALDRNEVKALVATTALGMGYDKPDLGFVIHYQAPGSIISYYQQVGRAGRGISRAVGLMMSGAEDGEIHSFFLRTAFPPVKWVRAVLEQLEGSNGLSAHELTQRLNLRNGQIQKVLKIAAVDDPAPIIKQGAKWMRTPVPWRPDRERIERLHRRREVEWAEVQAYLREEGCLMQFLGRSLDDPRPVPCGSCEGCLGHPVVPTAVDRLLAVEALRFLRQSEMPLKPRMQAAKGAFRVNDLPARLPVEWRAEEGRVLSRWGDAGWGRIVAEGKAAGHFDDELATAAVDMVRDRWRPDPAPRWVTAVPSLERPRLVPDFAARLARKLKLPFCAVVVKVKANEPQKLQQNVFRQCRNLDGVFAIRGAILKGPVLLVDDVVDSRLTLMVIAALLRKAGSGPVIPMALATANPGG